LYAKRTSSNIRFIKATRKTRRERKRKQKNNDEIKIELKKVELKVELSSNKAEQINIKTDTKLDIRA